MARRQTTSGRSRDEDQDILDDTFVIAPGDDSAGSTQPQIDERQTFGNTTATWMVVEISPDGLEAILKRITFGGDTTLTDQEILKALSEQYHINNGLDENLVQKLASRCLAEPDGTVSGNYLVACGSPAIPGKPGHLEYTFQQRIDDGTQPDYSEIKIAIEQNILAAVTAIDLRGLLVQPGEELARRARATRGEAGCDIFGNICLDPGNDPPLKAGANVRESDDRYLAEIYGYVCLADNQLSVIPPIWIDTEHMEAHYVHFSQVAAAPPLREKWLMDALIALSITHGIDEVAIAALAQNPPRLIEKATVSIARGTPPVPGEDTRVDYPFDPDKRAGKIMPDGSIDLRERNAVIGVEEGQYLGKIIEATEGIPGSDLRGVKIATTDGVTIVFKGGENVRTEGDPPRAFFADITGNVHLAGDTIHVNEVFVVSGDVNYDTGHIDTPNDVQIDGNVGAGFNVKSGGSITVGGLVEAGVILTAQGDITVGQGIVGEVTKVTAHGATSLGSIQTKFIQNATVIAKSDIEVGSYIFNSQVRSGGAVTVHAEGGARGGSIVGGETLASTVVRCRIVGSPSASGTLVGISSDPEKSARLIKLDEAISFCETNILRLLRSIGLQTMDAQRIKTIMRQTSPPKQKVIIEIVKKLYDLIEARDKSVAERESIDNQLDQALDKSKICIEHTLYSGVEVEMGRGVLVTKEDANAITLYKTPDGIQTRSWSG